MAIGLYTLDSSRDLMSDTGETRGLSIPLENKPKWYPKTPYCQEYDGAPHRSKKQMCRHVPITFARSEDKQRYAFCSDCGTILGWVR